MNQRHTTPIDTSVGVGHNHPPTLLDELKEETAPLQKRTNDLVLCADERSYIDDEDSASRAVQLLGQMKDAADEIEAARKARKEPFLRDGRCVDDYFHTLASPLDGSRGDLLFRVDAWRRLKAAKAAAERMRLEEEARKAREAAAAAEQELASAPPPEQATAMQEALRQHLDAATRLASQAASTVAAPINSGVGVRTSERRSWKAEIKDLKPALAYCLENGYEKNIRVIVQAIYDKLVNSKDGARNLPGAKITETVSTTILRK